jgi:hypothetical protein
MSVTRHPEGSQVPLARMALLAGEAFGHQSTPDAALVDSVYSGQMRSALVLALIVCAMIAAYLAV